MDIPSRRRRAWQAIGIGVLILLGLSRVDSSDTAPRSARDQLPPPSRPPLRPRARPPRTGAGRAPYRCRAASPWPGSSGSSSRS